jgi:DASS family divalent anion:Na+ symporter
MMLAFLTVGVHLVPAEYVRAFLLMMAAASAIMMTLTHYATGTSPIIFGSGYVGTGRWWGVGLAMALFQLAVYSTVGLLWWKVLGHW